ncbi:hypothetical protein HPP92_000541 [Vanilla planifolia]|uniref:Secreted protein n=1 Tax=Vanilla planifolia TaxID=51239 RepID=A0A835VG70_VANPL|nr:hypothetical protein HPP92_000541 [Vanilla planifolia]
MRTSLLVLCHLISLSFPMSFLRPLATCYSGRVVAPTRWVVKSLSNSTSDLIPRTPVATSSPDGSHLPHLQPPQAPPTTGSPFLGVADLKR